MKLSKKKLQELKDRKIHFEDLSDEYFVRPYSSADVAIEDDNIEDDNILILLSNNICSFKQLVDRIKHIRNRFEGSSLYMLLCNEKIFQKLFENHQLTTADLRYLLDEVNTSDEISYLSSNKALMKVIFERGILTKEDFDKFHIIIKNCQDWIDDLKNENFFKFVEYNEKFYFDSGIRKWLEKAENEIDYDLLSLNTLNNHFYDIDCFEFLSLLNDEKKKKLFDVLKDNEAALDRFNLIIENHLENNYDFDSLMNYLKKVEKKNLLNI